MSLLNLFRSSGKLQIGPPLHVDGRVAPRARPGDGLADVLHDPFARRELVGDGDHHRPFAKPFRDLGERGEQRRTGSGCWRRGGVKVEVEVGVVVVLRGSGGRGRRRPGTAAAGNTHSKHVQHI